jgi:hypothetical protein
MPWRLFGAGLLLGLAALPLIGQARPGVAGFSPEGIAAAPITVEYRIRLGSNGRFSLPPTRAEAMYAPDINALLPGSTLVVADAR